MNAPIRSWIAIVRSVSLLALIVYSPAALGGVAADELDKEYPSTTKNQKLFRAAVEDVNKVLQAGSPLQLIQVKSSRQILPTNFISIQLAKFPKDERGMAASVPSGRRIILVDAQEIPRLEMLFSTWLTNGLRLDQTKLLAICILHETGHIVNNDYTNYLPQVRVAGYNLDRTPNKELEERADSFAAGRIREALATTNRFECYGTAAMLNVEMFEVSWNLMQNRILNNFGATVLRRPSVLADADPYHPNLELRFLRLNFFVNPTTTSKQLLDDFMKARDEVKFGPNIIYQTK